MTNEVQHVVDPVRRTLVKSAALGAALPALAGGSTGQAAAAGPQSGPARPAAGPGPYNILFILTDQERHFRPGELPPDFRLPGHERLLRLGTRFENHRINSCVCTSSRSVLYTGRHIQHTKMFDNTNFPWISSMSTDIRTVGHRCATPGTTPPTRASGT